MKRNWIATPVFLFLASFSIAQADFMQLPWGRLIEITQDLPLFPAASDSRAYLARSGPYNTGDHKIEFPLGRGGTQWIEPSHLNRYFNPITVGETLCFLRIDLHLPPKPYFPVGTVFSTGLRGEFESYKGDSGYGLEQSLQIGKGIRIECFGPDGVVESKKFPSLSQLLDQFKEHWFMNFTDVPAPVKGKPIKL